MSDDDHYPNLRCTAHPERAPEPGYCVCVHVLEEGAPIAHYHDASPRALGEVLCEQCVHALDEWKTAEAFVRLICAACVVELLAARAPRVS